MNFPIDSNGSRIRLILQWNFKCRVLNVLKFRITIFALLTHTHQIFSPIHMNHSLKISPVIICILTRCKIRASHREELSSAFRKLLGKEALHIMKNPHCSVLCEYFHYFHFLGNLRNLCTEI